MWWSSVSSLTSSCQLLDWLMLWLVGSQMKTSHYRLSLNMIKTNINYGCYGGWWFTSPTLMYFRAASNLVLMLDFPECVWIKARSSYLKHKNVNVGFLSTLLFRLKWVPVVVGLLPIIMCIMKSLCQSFQTFSCLFLKWLSMHQEDCSSYMYSCVVKVYWSESI